MSSKKFKNKQKDSEFGKYLKSLRKSRGINSQKVIGNILGIDRNRIQRIEAGAELYVGEAIIYADWLSISLDSFLGRDEKPTIQMSEFKEFTGLIKDLGVLMASEKRAYVVDVWKGFIRDMAEIELKRMEPSPNGSPSPRRKEVEAILKKMSRSKYAK